MFKKAQPQQELPIKMIIWYGNPHIPWHVAGIPGGKLGQELTLSTDGHCQFRSMVFNETGRYPIPGVTPEKIELPPDVALHLVGDALDIIVEEGPMVDDPGNATQFTTVIGSRGKATSFVDYQADPDGRIKRISMRIRDTLNMADLMVFDGNSREDSIDQLVIDYTAPDQHTEHLELSRKDDTVRYQNELRDGSSFTTEYHRPDAVAELLDRFDPLDFNAPIPDPDDEEEAPTEEKHGHFNCQLVRRQLGPKEIIGTYEQRYLPNVWFELIEEITDVITFPAGDLLHPRLYQHRPSLDEVIYLDVTFTPDGRRYNYATTDNAIEVGDHVLVPAGSDNHEATVKVVGKHFYPKKQVPYPLDRVKEVIRRVDENELGGDD